MNLTCPQCRYDLAGTRAAGRSVTCPECGHVFSLSTADLQLPFFPLVLSVSGPAALLLAASVVSRASRGASNSGVQCFVPVVTIAAAIAFSVGMSGRWPEPWRTPIRARYLVASLALAVATIGIWALASIVIFAAI